MLESRPPSSSGPVTRSLFSLKPPPLPRAANGSAGSANGPGSAAGALPPAPAPDAPVEDVVLTKLKGAAQALPPSVAPTSVRAIRSAQLMRALSEALAPERRRFEQELARSRQRAVELEAELERIRAERKDVDETRRVELPRLAALVDRERTRAEELERERETFATRVGELEAELLRREAQARALESALPPESTDDDVLARVQRRLDALVAPAPAPAAAANIDDGDGAPAVDDVVDTELAASSSVEVGDAPSSGRAAGGDDLLMQALLSSDARALRIAALEQRVAALTGEGADLPGADEPPAARAVVALLRASQEEARARADRVEGRVNELLELTRDLHGALVEERRRRALVEGALRAAQARLSVLEQREVPSVRLPSFASVIKGDVGPLLDAVRDEARRRDDSLDGRIQRLSLATRAALERMAEILDQALVAGLFDRDMPRLDPEAFSAPLFEALAEGAAARAVSPDHWRDALDALDPELDGLEADEEVEDDDDHDDEAARRLEQADDGPPDDEDPGPDLAGRGDAPAGSVAPATLGPPGATTTILEAVELEEPDAAADDDDADVGDVHVEGPAFVEHLDEEPEDYASEEELASWFRPGRPGQTDAEREAEQLARFDLEVPSTAAPAPAAPARADTGGADTGGADTGGADTGGADFGGLEQLEPAQADVLRSAAEGDVDRQRLEERVREAERALESEVWRGLATHRELVSARQRLEELEARLAAGALTPAAEPPRVDEVAPTLGGLEPIPDVTALRDELTGDVMTERAAVLSLDVEDRDTWVHWLLLEHDPVFQARRLRAVRSCVEAMRSAERDSAFDELMHWLERERSAAGG